MALDYLAYARMAHGGYHAVRTAHKHRHRVAVALSFLIPFLTYAFSASHSVGARDVAEMQGVPYLLGIAHPTGYPLFIVLGWIFSHVFEIGSLAYRMNLFGALCMGLTCATGLVTALRIGVGPVTALGAFLCFGFARIVWFHGAQADTQNLALLFQALTLYYLCGWLIHARTRDIVAASACFAAAIAAHPISLWLLPAFGFAKLARLRSITFANAGASIMAFVLVLCVYAYLPIRAAQIEQHPIDAVQMMAPPAARVFWDVNAPSTWHGFVTEVSGITFGAPSLWTRIVDPRHWIGYLQSLYATIHGAYDILFVVIAALGIIMLVQKRSAVCVMLLLAALCAAFTALALAPVEGDPGRYLMLVLWIGALFAGAITVDFTWTVDPRRMVWALLLLGNAIAVAISSSSVAAQQRGVNERPLLSWASANIPQRSIVVAPWAQATTLAYGAYADGTFAQRTIVAGKPLQYAAQYGSWMRTEPVYVVSPAAIHNALLMPTGKTALGLTLYRVAVTGAKP